MFVVKTQDGIIIGPFRTYERAEKWAKKSVFHVDIILSLIPPRPDMLKSNAPGVSR